MMFWITLFAHPAIYLLISNQLHSEGTHSSLFQDWKYSCHPRRQSVVTTTEVLRAHMLAFRWWPQVQEDRAGRSPGLGCKKQLQTRVLTAEHTYVTVQDHPLSAWLTCSPITTVSTSNHGVKSSGWWKNHQCYIASWCPHSFPVT